jgi:hypothetical protein
MARAFHQLQLAEKHGHCSLERKDHSHTWIMKQSAMDTFSNKLKLLLHRLASEDRPYIDISLLKTLYFEEFGEKIQLSSGQKLIDLLRQAELEKVCQLIKKKGGIWLVGSPEEQR